MAGLDLVVFMNKNFNSFEPLHYIHSLQTLRMLFNEAQSSALQRLNAPGWISNEPLSSSDG